MECPAKPDNAQKIEICANGPYIVTGNLPLVAKSQLVSEYGEPLAWSKDAELAAGEGYFLCRCGHSDHKPFCDGTHAKIQFDGAETAASSLYAQRARTYAGSTNIYIRRDDSLCALSGFCANRVTSLAEMAGHTGDTQVRAMAIAMIEHCPSGALTYSLVDQGEDVEVDLPRQVAVVTDVISAGPIRGPLWVTGGIPIRRADGQPFETRNRVTLCCCGRSCNKPLCDGAHRSPQVD